MPKEQGPRSEEAVAERQTELGFAASAMVHDLRSPLAVMATYSQLLANEDDPQRKASFLQTLQDSVHQMDGLLESVLEFVRPQARIPVESFSPQSLADELGSLAELLEASSFPVKLSLQARGSAGWGPREALRRLAQNLIHNAAAAQRQHTAGEEAKIQVVLQHTPRGWTLRVVDNGPGLPMDIARFLEGIDCNPPEEARLGVLIVRWLVERYGGQIRVSSEAGQGTDIQINLPAPKLEELGANSGRV